MKKAIIILTIALFASVSYAVRGQLIIKGFIKDHNHNKVDLFEPINGFYNQDFPGPNSEIQISRKGYFEKKIKLDNRNMLCLRIGIEPVYFFAEPGDTINIMIDANKFSDYSPNGGIIFKGKNSKGNEYFNSFNWQPGRKFGDFAHIADDSLHFRETNDFNAIYLALNRVTSHFDTLLNRKLITQSFYDVVVPGIKAVLVTSEIRYLFVGQNSMSFKQSMALANKIYRKVPVTLSMIKQNVFGSYVAYYYYDAMAGKHYSSIHLADSMLTVRGKKVFVNSNLVYWLYAPKEVQEILWAQSLISLKKMFADHYGESDVDAFLALHPNSPVKRYLIYSFKELDSPVNAQDSSLIIRIQDTTAKTFSDYIKRHFHGKKLYVDLWASWCVPCKQEFSFAKDVDSFCNKNDIKVLYISIDEPNMKSAMLRDIYAYNLKGYHTRVSKELYLSIKKVFYPESQVFTVPRYILINEKGKVINSDAPRPSSGNKLFNVMKNDFKLKD